MVLPDWSKDLNLNLHLPKSTQQISLGELSVGRSPKSTLATAPAVSHWGEVSLHLPTGHSAHWHHNQVGLTKSSIKIRPTTTGENFHSARRIFRKPWESPLRPDKFSWPQMFTWSWKSLFGQEKFHSLGNFASAKMILNNPTNLHDFLIGIPTNWCIIWFLFCLVGRNIVRDLCAAFLIQLLAEYSCIEVDTHSPAHTKIKMMKSDTGQKSCNAMNCWT